MTYIVLIIIPSLSSSLCVARNDHNIMLPDATVVPPLCCNASPHKFCIIIIIIIIIIVFIIMMKIKMVIVIIIFCNQLLSNMTAKQYEGCKWRTQTFSESE